MWRRCRQAADALRKAGVGKDDTISVLSPNSVATLEMHYAASMAGGVLNASSGFIFCLIAPAHRATVRRYDAETGTTRVFAVQAIQQSRLIVQVPL
jgi:acyl-CoA synthetase (AMP-forming)/AMP-acid ligase II